MKTMENLKIFEGFAPSPSDAEVSQILERVTGRLAQNAREEVYKFCHSVIDLTTLSSTDSVDSVRDFARRAVAFSVEHPDIPPVATLCVYPSFVEVVGLELDATPLRITSAAGGFPASQTFMEVKALECAMAVESGADEIDVVLNVGMVLSSSYEEAAAEIELLREELGEDVILKVIIESGVLRRSELVYRASLLSAQAGADFVKTSTGKESSVADARSAIVMCLAIKAFYERCGRRVGFKAAGGIRSAQDALLYYTIVEETLGCEWLSPERFRLGASSLSAELVGCIKG